MSRLVEPIGLALLHFLWQGAVLALALGIGLLCARKGDPRLRYALCCATLLAMALAPIGTAIALRPPVTPDLPVARPFVPPARVKHVRVVYRPMPASPVSPLSRYLPGVVSLWMCGVAALSLRMLGGLWLVERLRRLWSRPAPPEWQERFEVLRIRLGIGRSVRLLVSDRVKVPSAVGVFRAAVILPASLILKFAPDQVETLILHELAHIRRLDYLVNLLQSCVETLLFYHPAVWWVSHVARLEREHCCDQIVIGVTGDSGLYARTLAQLEQQLSPLPHLSMSARGGQLMQRVVRILSRKPNQPRPIAVWPSIVAVTALAVGISETVHAQADHSKPKPAAKTHKAAKPKALRRSGNSVAKQAARRSAQKGASATVEATYSVGATEVAPKDLTFFEPGVATDWVKNPPNAEAWATKYGVTIYTPPQRKDITLQLDGVPIREALKQISTQIRFSYSIAPPNPMERFRYNDVVANIDHQSLEQAIRAVAYSAGAKFHRDESGTYYLEIRSPMEHDQDQLPVGGLGPSRPGFGGAQIPSHGGGNGGFGMTPSKSSSGFGGGGLGGGLGAAPSRPGPGLSGAGGFGGGSQQQGLGGGGFGGGTGGGFGAASSRPGSGLTGAGGFGGGSQNQGLGGSTQAKDSGARGFGGGPQNQGLGGSTQAKDFGGSGFGGFGGGTAGNTSFAGSGGLGAATQTQGQKGPGGFGGGLAFAPQSIVDAHQDSGKFRLHMRGATVVQAAEALAKASGKSILVAPGAKGETVDVNATGLSFATALDSICKSSGNSFSVHDGVYTIAPKKEK